MKKILLLLFVPGLLSIAAAQQLINNPKFQGAAQSDLDLGSHSLTNGVVGWSMLSGIPSAGGDLGGSYPSLTVTNGAHLAAGTVPNAALQSSVTLQGNTFNAAGKLAAWTGDPYLESPAGAYINMHGGGGLTFADGGTIYFSGNPGGGASPGGGQIVWNNGSATAPIWTASQFAHSTGGNLYLQGGLGSGTCDAGNVYGGGGSSTGTYGGDVVTSGGTAAGAHGGTLNLGGGTVAGGSINLSNGSGTLTLGGGAVLTLPASTGTLLLANGSGSALTALNASSLSSGTVADARLSANIPLLNANNTFTSGLLKMISTDNAGSGGFTVYDNNLTQNVRYSARGPSNDVGSYVFVQGIRMSAADSNSIDIGGKDWALSNDFISIGLGITSGGVCVAPASGGLPPNDGINTFQVNGSIRAQGLVTMTANTTGTITFSSNYQNQTIYNTSATTIASATLTLPSATTPGQIARYVTAGAVTALTVSGSVDVGAALTSLAANASVAWEADNTTGHWIRIQ